MKNRKILAITLPLIAATTVVGSGFAAWYFGNQAEAQSTNIGITITNEVTTGSLKLKFNSTNNPAFRDLTPENTLSLVLDQGYQGLTELDKGIYFTVKEKTDTVILDQIQFEYTISKANLQDLNNAGYQVFVKPSIEFKTSLLKYVEVKNAGSVDAPSYEWAPELKVGKPTSTNTGSKYEGKVEVKNAEQLEMVTLTGSFKFLSQSETLSETMYHTNTMLKYKTNDVADDVGSYQGGKPRTAKQLEAMRKELGTGADVSLSFAELVEQTK